MGDSKNSSLNKRDLVQRYLAKRRSIDFQNPKRVYEALVAYKKRQTSTFLSLLNPKGLVWDLTEDQERIFEKPNAFEQTQNFICPICMEYICNATSTSCGHTFCERCIFESILLQPVRPANLKWTNFALIWL